MDLTSFYGRKTELRDLGFLQDVFDGLSICATNGRKLNISPTDFDDSFYTGKDTLQR